MRRQYTEDEEVYQEEEVNVTNEPDYDIPEDDYTIYQEEEQVITDELPSISKDTMDLIKLGKKIKSTHATNKFRSKKSE
jgi:hypothetical protein